tara:strand:+ start:6424 stop:7644 length:1221 start_codon:yes stop_codon:yes gene_type:complete
MKVIQIFNRYRHRGGEEKSAERIFRHVGEKFEIEKLWWDSRDWDRPNGPGKLGQVRKMFCNEDTACALRERIRVVRPDFLLCHNVYPVGSPSIYREALDAGVPVVQYVHNFRPFSVGGTLWTGTRVAEESLQGNYWAEVRAGSWQGSALKSGLFALALKRLHKSGWLDAVKGWIGISDFMRDALLRAGLPREQVFALRHSWDHQEKEPEQRDEGYYLYLARLVREKGVRTLLDSWEILERSLGDSTPLLKIGGTGDEEQLVRAAASRSRKVEYVGYVDGEEKDELVAGCRAMLAPSVWWEPLGLVTYEAYDHGKPMLAAASGGLIETVEHGGTGLLYESASPSALAESVETMEAMSRERRWQMGLAGREWLKKEADPGEWKMRFDHIVRQVAGREKEAQVQGPCID